MLSTEPAKIDRHTQKYHHINIIKKIFVLLNIRR